MQESLVFLIMRVGRLRKDQLIYVDSREKMFFYDMGPLNNTNYNKLKTLMRLTTCNLKTLRYFSWGAFVNANLYCN